jgi:DNA-binding MarR family transcriptional regulator
MTTDLAETSAEDAGSGSIDLGRSGRTIAYHLRLAQNASFQSFADLAGEAGLRPGRYALLQLIHDNPGISQTDLSRAAGRDKTTLTPALNDMERRGLITRRPHPTDRRSRMLALTPAGEEKLVKLAEYAARHDSSSKLGSGSGFHGV